MLERDEYRRIAPDAQGILRSAFFPGLVLQLDAVLRQDAAKVLDVLQAALQAPAHTAFVQELASRKES